MGARPNRSLGAELTAIGLDAADQTRAAMRFLIHISTNAPPEDGATTDELALRVLKLNSMSRLKRFGYDDFDETVPWSHSPLP